MKPNNEKGIPRLVSVRVVAEALGLSKSHVYSLAHTGDIPAITFGRVIRFDPADIQRFLNNRKGKVRE